MTIAPANPIYKLRRLQWKRKAGVRTITPPPIKDCQQALRRKNDRPLKGGLVKPISSKQPAVIVLRGRFVRGLPSRQRIGQNVLSEAKERAYKIQSNRLSY
jgi:hypothetical protein